MSFGTKLGAINESRFLLLFKEKLSDTPDWFMRMEQASVDLDIRGVDVLAYIKFSEESEEIRIPLQIKSSKHGKRSSRQTHTQYTDRVHVFVVNSSRGDREIRSEVYSFLNAERESGNNYEALIRSILATTFSPERKAKYERMVRALREELEPKR